MSALQATLQTVHLVAGLVVLVEALNKLERTAPLAPGLTPNQRLVDGLKALAWALLALGAGGALAVPLMQPIETVHGNPARLLGYILQPVASLADVCVLGGFAVLIIRTRIKEG